MVVERKDGEFDVPWDIRYLLGTINTRLQVLEDRTAEDRDLATKRHVDNQEAMGELRDKMQSAIGELRLTTAAAVTDLKNTIKMNGHGIPMSTPHRAALITIGVAFLGALLWVIQAVLGSFSTWLLTHFKFGS